MSIEVNAVSKLFGTQRAVDNIHFYIPKGEIVGFLGPNGAGKSTTMKMITGFLQCSEGSIQVCGKSIQDDELAYKAQIGYLPESNPLYYDMYVREYLLYVAKIYKIKNPEARIEELIELTGLSREAHKLIGQLSKGYKQRVGLAQALIHDPEVLILDEPTSGLDPNQILEIRELIKKIGQSKTVLLSTHIMQEVSAMCNRVIIISKGKIVADKPIQELSINTSTPALTLKAKNSIDSTLFKKLSARIEEIDTNTIRIYADNIDQIKNEVLSIALNNNLDIISIGREEASLEEVFRTLTTS